MGAAKWLPRTCFWTKRQFKKESFFTYAQICARCVIGKTFMKIQTILHLKEKENCLKQKIVKP